MSELKRCPFCGGEAELRTFTPTLQFVQCRECLARTTEFEDSDEAISAWNNRNTLFTRLMKEIKAWLMQWLKS